jgi:phosphatidylserine/phosphatidylglycerophosphate/cardiolipin synthase-like enzyme
VSNSVEALIEVIDRIARELPPETIHSLTARLEASEQPLVIGELAHLAPARLARQLLQPLESSLAGVGTVRRSAVALALRSSMLTAKRASDSTTFEIAWTGPATAAIPVRRVDQVMYELVEGTQRDLILTSYVAHGAENALDALRSATDRGVEVTLILERARETGGKLAFDSLDSIVDRVPKATIYYWPIEKRQASRQGAKGILHAKCLICDGEHALVSSANLTDQGLESNMELGLVLHGGDAPKRLAAHFRHLIYERELKELGRS